MGAQLAAPGGTAGAACARDPALQRTAEGKHIMVAARNAAWGARHARQAGQQAADAPVTGLSAVRDELERQPRDPFAGDVQAILAELETDWGGLFGITYDGRWWTATPRDGTGGTLRELSPDELIAAMRAAR